MKDLLQEEEDQYESDMEDRHEGDREKGEGQVEEYGADVNRTECIAGKLGSHEGYGVRENSVVTCPREEGDGWERGGPAELDVTDSRGQGVIDCEGQLNGSTEHESDSISDAEEDFSRMTK